MASINPSIPIFNPHDGYPLLGLRQFIKGFFDESGRQYKVVGQEALITLVTEEQRVDSPNLSFYKLIARCTVIIWLAAVVFHAVHSYWGVQHYKLVGQRPVSQETTRREQAPAKPVSEDVARGVGELTDELDALFQDLHNLNTKGPALLEKWNAVEARFKADLEGDVGKVFSRFQYVKATVEGLMNLSKALLVGAKPRLDPLKEGTIEVPGDGNCLFHALANGLILNDRVSTIQHDQLRAGAVQWMRDHYSSDEQLRNYIEEAIDAYKVSLVNAKKMELQSLQASLQFEPGRKNEIEALMVVTQKELEEAEKPLTHEDYFRLVERPNFFASIAELYAVSVIYKCQIHIVREIAGRVVEGFDLPINPQFGEDNIITVLHKGGDHFNNYVPIATPLYR